MMVRFLLPGVGQGRGRRRRRAGGRHLPCPFPRRPGADRGSAAAGRGAPRVIARLRGILAGIGDDHAIVDVAGVGYLVTVAPATLERLPRVGRSGRAAHRAPAARGRDDALRLPRSCRPDLVSPAADRPGRGRPGGAVAAGHAAAGTSSPMPSPPATRRCWRAPRASAARLAARIAAELKDRVGPLPQPGRAETGRRSPGGRLAATRSRPCCIWATAGRRPTRRWPGSRRGWAAEVAVDALVREGLKELTA